MRSVIFWKQARLSNFIRSGLIYLPEISQEEWNELDASL